MTNTDYGDHGAGMFSQPPTPPSHVRGPQPPPIPRVGNANRVRAAGTGPLAAVNEQRRRLSSAGIPNIPGGDTTAIGETMGGGGAGHGVGGFSAMGGSSVGAGGAGAGDAGVPGGTSTATAGGAPSSGWASILPTAPTTDAANPGFLVSPNLGSALGAYVSAPGAPKPAGPRGGGGPATPI